MDNNLNELFQQLAGEEGSQVIGSLFSMSDEQFSIVAPAVLEDFLKSLNAPNFQLALAQTANVNGVTIDEIIDGIHAIIEKIPEMKIENFSIIKKNFLRQIFVGMGNAISETQSITKRILQVPFEKTLDSAKEPIYAHLTDSGADIFAAEDLTIDPGQTRLLSTGLKVQIPAGYELQIRPKSGISLKTKLRIANSPATIDESYRGVVGVIIDNIEPPIRKIDFHKNENGEIISSVECGRSYTIEKGQKIAQFVLSQVPKAHFVCVDRIDENTDRKDGAFGSTGLK